MHALVLAFDYGYDVRDAQEDLTKKNAELEAYVDSRSMLNVVPRMALRQRRGYKLIYLL